ncbi:hypothetical protein ACFVXC_34280 [Streptomyces sp. NPDC058257]|uniref:hypothetical protein n=1 Tax=Streptomyces sp. NPDC058257 TaxID=3346409 RepID=UPI0036E22CEA
MSRRVSLPGADELFRTTGGMALQSSSPRRQTNGEARVPPPAGESDEAAAVDAHGSVTGGGGGDAAEHGAADAESGESRSRSATADAEKDGRRPDQGQEGAAAQGGRSANSSSTAQARRRARAANRRPSGRERHDEKITVYVSAEELMDLEHARLVLRGEHGLAVDRGRIVREAVAVVLADLESRGDASILVRRLRGR